MQPLLAPVANFIAIPYARMVLVPLTLLGTLLSAFNDTLARVLLTATSVAFDALWMFLTSLANAELLIVPVTAPSAWRLLLALLGVALLVAPAGVPGRALGIVVLLPLFLAPAERPPYGAVRVAVLDVGQGLSTVIETQHHVLIYDTGPRYSEQFDAGQAVIIPYLRSRGIARVDRILLSHGDLDHIGGLDSLHKARIGTMVMTNTDRGPVDATPCLAATRWHWDGIEFSVLHPRADDVGRRNDLSCVLRVEAPGGAVLLPGDIEARAESVLLQRYPNQLRAVLLVAPHHGSATSSTEAFLAAVQPRYTVFSAGYGNRFGFPRPRVTQRYDRHGIRYLNTADSGAVEFLLSPDTGISEPSEYRQAARGFWHH